MSVDTEEICRKASYLLGLLNVLELFQGDIVNVQDVDVECWPEANCFRLFFDLGPIQADVKVDVYDTLLALQIGFPGEVDAMFVRDQVNDRMLWVVCVRFTHVSTGERLADVINAGVQQIHRWRKTFLLGNLLNPERDTEDTKQVDPLFAELAY